MALGLALAVSVVAAGVTAAPAGAASSIGPFVLTGGGSLPAVQVPSLLSFSFSTQGNLSGKGYGGGKYAPHSASELTITKLVDKTSPQLAKATALGSHYSTGALSWTNGTKSDGLCLTDAFITSDQTGSSGGGDLVQEKIEVDYAKLKFTVGSKSPCGNKSAGGGPPAVEASLLGVGRHDSSLLSRVDCLSAHCRGILTVSLPPAACPAGGTLCSFTGGIRVGLNGGGKVHFNGDGTATLNGGTRVGLNGSGKFSMGDGSVKIVKLSVPPSLQKWVSDHQNRLFGAIIVVVRGQNTALVQRGVLNPPAKLPSGAPSETLDVQGLGSPGQPTDLSQSLNVTSCATPVVGTKKVTVSGSLTPARAGAKVTLTYTADPGLPALPPSPVVDSVTTDAVGGFSEDFDRQQGGIQDSWGVVASIAEGDGYAATQSASCAIPIP